MHKEVAAVIVTFNRLEKLKEALQKQEDFKPKSRQWKGKKTETTTDNTKSTENTEIPLTSQTLRTSQRQTTNDNVSQRVSRALDIIFEISEKALDISLSQETEKNINESIDIISMMKKVLRKREYSDIDRMIYLEDSINDLDVMLKSFQKQWEKDISGIREIGSMMQQKLNPD